MGEKVKVRTPKVTCDSRRLRSRRAAPPAADVAADGHAESAAAAAAASMLLLLLLLRWLLQGGARADWAGSAADWGGAALCTVLVCLLEAFTSQIDNLFLPVYYSAILLSLAT